MAISRGRAGVCAPGCGRARAPQRAVQADPNPVPSPAGVPSRGAAQPSAAQPSAQQRAYPATHSARQTRRHAAAARPARSLPSQLSEVSR